MPPVLSGLQIEVGDVYSESWNVFKAQLKPAAAIVGIMMLVGWLVPIVLIGGGVAASNFESDQIAPALVGGGIGFILMMAMMFAGFAGLFALYLDALRGRPVSVGAAMSRGAGKLPMLFITGICWFVAYFVGILMCCVPGILALFGLYMWPGVVFEEDLGPIDSLQRAWDLADGHKVNVFLNYLVFWFMNMVVGVVSLVISAGALGIVGVDDSTATGGMPAALLPQLVGQAIQMFLSLGLMPFHAALICVMYDRRTRNPAMPGMQVAQVFS